MRLGTFLSVHHAVKIKASSVSESPGMLRIELEPENWMEGQLQLAIFTDDQVLSDRLAAAISAVVQERKEEIEMGPQAPKTYEPAPVVSRSISG